MGFTPDLFIGVKASYNLTHVLGTQDIATVTAGRINANRYAYWDLKSKNKTTPELFFLVNCLRGGTVCSCGALGWGHKAQSRLAL